MKRVLAIFLGVLLYAGFAAAATVHGTVYDFSLDSAINSVIDVNSSPAQKCVAKDGTYSFKLGIGSYLIKATYQSDSGRSYLEQKVVIEKEGDYLIDLIMFPDMSDEEELAAENITVPDISFREEGSSNLEAIVAVIAALAILLIVFFLFSRRRKKDLIPDDKQNIYEFIRKKKRTTQKELSVQFPFSNSKISLIIAELEHEGKVEKIKKGRGNILILK